jgi:hypothetical protein
MNKKPVYGYQLSNHGCFPAALLNALTRLWRPHEIPATIVRAVYRNSLDARSAAGTSDEACQRIVDELTAIVAARRGKKRFCCTARRLVGHQVTIAPNGLIARTIRAGGSAVVDVYYRNSTHALTLLDIDTRWWTLFDPSLWERYPRKHRGIERLGHPGISQGPNLRIELRHLDIRRHEFYTLGPLADREAIIVMPW